jgi:hypothetical protein
MSGPERTAKIERLAGGDELYTLLVVSEESRWLWFAVLFARDETTDDAARDIGAGDASSSGRETALQRGTRRGASEPAPPSTAKRGISRRGLRRVSRP